LRPHACAYRKPKRWRSGDEVRPGWRELITLAATSDRSRSRGLTQLILRSGRP
jgi:hypothetical protein